MEWNGQNKKQGPTLTPKKKGLLYLQTVKKNWQNFQKSLYFLKNHFTCTVFSTSLFKCQQQATVDTTRKRLITLKSTFIYNATTLCPLNLSLNPLSKKCFSPWFCMTINAYSIGSAPSTSVLSHFHFQVFLLPRSKHLFHFPRNYAKPIIMSGGPYFQYNSIKNHVSDSIILYSLLINCFFHWVGFYFFW